MDVGREDFSLTLDGPLAEVDVAGIPTGFLYAVVLSVAATARAWPQVLQVLSSVLGEPKETRKWFRDAAWFSNPQAQLVRVGNRLRLVFGQRVKASRLADVVHALQQVPDVADLRLQGQRRVFAEPGSLAGPQLE